MGRSPSAAISTFTPRTIAIRRACDQRQPHRATRRIDAQPIHCTFATDRRYDLTPPARAALRPWQDWPFGSRICCFRTRIRRAAYRVAGFACRGRLGPDLSKCVTELDRDDQPVMRKLDAIGEFERKQRGCDSAPMSTGARWINALFCCIRFAGNLGATWLGTLHWRKEGAVPIMCRWLNSQPRGSQG